MKYTNPVSAFRAAIVPYQGSEEWGSSRSMPKGVSTGNELAAIRAQPRRAKKCIPTAPSRRDRVIPILEDHVHTDEAPPAERVLASDFERNQQRAKSSTQPQHRHPSVARELARERDRSGNILVILD
jgi:hypothetical protein